MSTYQDLEQVLVPEAVKERIAAMIILSLNRYKARQLSNARYGAIRKHSDTALAEHLFQTGKDS